MMFHLLKVPALATSILASTLGVAPERAAAQSYQIDCAILLCLSGGWPPSVPCARARAEFIRRITPWPVEPPLQIWRCPMGAAFTTEPDALTADRIYDILLELGNTPAQSLRGPSQLHHSQEALLPQPAVVRHNGGPAPRLPDGFVAQLVQDADDSGNGIADIDISGTAFDFVRSIRVFNVTYARQRESGRDNDCNRSFAMRIGSYGTQGDFRWARGYNLGQLPDAHVGLERYGQTCPGIFHRSVFVEWQDYEGNYGFEQVNY